MTQQYDSLNEQTKRLDMSLKYTNGDLDKAKEMAAGHYNDIKVLKGKFVAFDSGQSGMFFAFFNLPNEYISFVDGVISSVSSIYDKVRVFDDWRSLYKDFIGYKKSDEVIDSEGFADFFLDSLIKYDAFPDVEKENLNYIKKTINEIVAQSFNLHNVQCQIELESTSSLEMEIQGVPIDMPGLGEDDGVLGEAQGEDERIKSIEAEANYIVEGKVIVSPVKGKYINDVISGDKVMVTLPKEDPVSEKILSVLNAKDSDGNILPIKGRLKDKIPMESGGYILYILVAKGVFAKVIEDENVKIQVDQPAEQIKLEAKSGNLFIYLMAALVGFIIVTGIILIQLLM